jgi:hypothetical protein
MTALSLYIDAPAALDLLRGARDSKPPFYRYEAPEGELCVYEHGGAPSCIFGTALHLAGVPVEVLRHLDNFGGLVCEDTQEALLAAGIYLTPDALAAFIAAQTAQDTHTVSWCDAVKAAELAA